MISLFVSSLPSHLQQLPEMVTLLKFMGLQRRQEPWEVVSGVTTCCRANRRTRASGYEDQAPIHGHHGPSRGHGPSLQRAGDVFLHDRHGVLLEARMK